MVVYGWKKGNNNQKGRNSERVHNGLEVLWNESK